MEIFNERVIAAADANVFLWGERTHEERLKLLTQIEDTMKMRVYNDLFEDYIRTPERFGSSLDMIWENGNILPIVYDAKTGTGYSPMVTRDTLNEKYSIQPVYGKYKSLIKVQSLDYEESDRNNHAPLRVVVYPIGPEPRYYHVALVKKTETRAPYTTYDDFYAYGLYMRFFRRKLLASWQLSETHRILSSMNFVGTEATTERWPVRFGTLAPKLPEIYEQTVKSKLRANFVELKDKTSYSLYYWASGVILGTRLLSYEAITQSPAFDKINDLVQSTQRVIEAHKKTSCKHFGLRSRFDAAFKSDTKRGAFIQLMGISKAAPDERSQYQCEYCDLELYCEHEYQQYHNKSNTVLEKFGQFSRKDDNVTCRLCSRVIGVAPPDTVEEYDENDRLIVGKSVVTKLEKNFKEFLGIVIAAIKGFPKMSVTDIYEDLRTVIDLVYQQANKKRTMTQINVNLLIICAWISYAVIERQIPIRLFSASKTIPDVAGVIKDVVDRLSSNLYLHGIIEQLPHIQKWTKGILDSFVYPQLGGTAKSLTKQRQNTFSYEYVEIVNYDTLYSKYLDDLPRNEGPGGSFNRILRNRPKTAPRILYSPKFTLYTFVTHHIDGHMHVYDKGKCEACGAVFSEQVALVAKMTAEDQTKIREAATAYRLTQMARKYCPFPRRSAHYVVFDVCINCGMRLNEIAKYKPTPKELEAVDIKESEYVLNVLEPTVPARDRQQPGSLETAIDEFIKVLAKASPKSIDPFKNHIKAIRNATDVYSFVSEYVTRFSAAKRVKEYTTVDPVTALCLVVNDMLLIDNPANAVVWLGNYAALVEAKKYDPLKFVYEEIRLMNDIHYKFLEEFSKTMEQKIAEAILDDTIEEYSISVDEDNDDDELPAVIEDS